MILKQKRKRTERMLFKSGKSLAGFAVFISPETRTLSGKRVLKILVYKGGHRDKSGTKRAYFHAFSCTFRHIAQTLFRKEKSLETPHGRNEQGSLGKRTKCKEDVSLLLLLNQIRAAVPKISAAVSKRQEQAGGRNFCDSKSFNQRRSGCRGPQKVVRLFGERRSKEASGRRFFLPQA